MFSGAAHKNKPSLLRCIKRHCVTVKYSSNYSHN